MLIDQSTLFESALGSCKITCIVTGEEWKQNTYIVTHVPSNNAIIIDPGDSADFIINHVQDRGEKVTRILLTHPHHDHVGAAAQVSSHFSVACELHNQDIRLLMHAPMYALRFANKKILSVLHYQPFEELCICREEPAVRSIHTPGHTKGSVCYVFDGFVMTGDTLLFEHVGRTDLPGSSAEEIVMSIEVLLLGMADETVIFSGHGKPWTVGEAKRWWRALQVMPPTYRNFHDEIN